MSKRYTGRLELWEGTDSASDDSRVVIDYVVRVGGASHDAVAVASLETAIVETLREKVRQIAGGN